MNTNNNSDIFIDNSSGVEQGSWQPLKNVMGITTRDMLKLTNNLVDRLNQLENQAIRMPQMGETVAPVSQPIDYKEMLESAQILEQELKSRQSYQALQRQRILKRAVIGLRFRLEEVNGGWDHKQVDQIQLDTLLKLASYWKSSQELFDETELGAEDLEKLKETSAYPQFVELLTDDRDIRHSFFQWIIRDKLAVAVFIQFPALQTRIVEAMMNGRISAMGSHMLRIQMREVAAGVNEKIVTLPFEGKEISLLDEAQVVTFRGSYTLTIKEIFDIFKAKVHSVGNLELLDEGVINWNAHLLGWWDADRHQYQQVDFGQAGWWKDLPVAVPLTLKQASERYKIKLDGIQWVVAACATRSRRTLAPKGSHAFLEVAVPTSKGHYNVYSFGKFAFKWATTALETLVAFTDVHDATIAYPDENIYFTNRQHARHAFAVSPETGVGLMHAIRDDMVQARTNNLIYQWEGDNCAKWVQDKLEKFIKTSHVLDLRAPMLESQPSDASRYLFAALRKLPSALQSPILSLLHYPLGAWRGKWTINEGKKVWRSLTTSQFWERKVVYLPAMVHVYSEGKLSPAEPASPRGASMSSELVASYATIVKDNSQARMARL